jgi:hypothetical protein
MLHEVEILEARRIADLSAAAREARDQALRPLPETDLGEIRPARGAHHAAGTFGFQGMPADEPAHRAFRGAVETLPADIRRKLWAVMRIGCGDYARSDWDRAIAEAEAMSEENVISDLVEEVDLHDKLMKGLYEIGAALPPP